MTQTTDAALVERLRALLDRRRSAGEAYDRLLAEVEAQPIDEDDDDDRGLRRSHSAVMVASSLLSHASVEAVPVLLDTIEAQARRIEALEEAGADKWWLRDSDVSRMARSIMHRLGHEPSMKELWARLERAEADRDRMMNALQEVQSRATNGKVTLDPRTRTIINRALSRIQPHRPEVTP